MKKIFTLIISLLSVLNGFSQGSAISFTPDSILLNLNCENGPVTVPITFQNDTSITNSFSIPTGGLPLDSVLNRINARNANLTTLIPSMYAFVDGVTGVNISDGGGDMYDGGNELNTDISGTTGIPYSDNLIVSSTDFGATGQYFTRKVPGLFVMAADIDNISLFNITGNLGADGSGSSDGAVLTTNAYGSTFTGFVNRTYNAGDPSINRLIIVKDNPTAAHTFLTTTSLEDHEVTGLNSSTRLYYLLFASQSGNYVTDAEVQLIMDEFITWLEAIPEYMTINPTNGTLAPGASTVVNVTIDPAGYPVGTYSSDIPVNGSFGTVLLHSDVTITGNAVVNYNTTCLDFGTVIQNTTTTMTIGYPNVGCADLTVSGTSITNGAYTITSYDGVVSPGDSGLVTIDFNPTAVGNYDDSIHFTMNVGDSAVCILGNAGPAPIIRVTPDPLVVNLNCGDSLMQNITIHNDGGSDLIINNGVIGGGGVYDTSTVLYTTTGALTTHNFNITNTGMDTLWIMVAVNGDYDSGIGANEYITDVSIDGISLGIAGTQALTGGMWDSTLFYITGADISTVLADGMVSITVQSGSGVNSGFGGAFLDLHHVLVYTNGVGWMNGTVPTTTVLAGDSLTIPVTFYSFGLSAGVYNSTITINTNDPSMPTYSLPVTLNLSGTADYTLSDNCLDFGTVIVNTTNTLTLDYTNTGCATLNLTGNSIAGAAYSVLSFDNTVGIGTMGQLTLQFTPTTVGNHDDTLYITTNVQDTAICITGNAGPAPVITVTPDPLIVNLACGDSTVENIVIHNNGGSDLIINNGIIGGGGVKDSSTVTYTTTGAMTTHNFNVTNTGLDTLWIMVAAHGDYDGGIGANEYVSDVSVDGISLGIAATQALTIGNWDSTLLYMVDPDLSTVLADGQIAVTVQAGTGVNTGFGGALDQHHVRIYTNGEGWLAGSITPTTVLAGDSLVLPVSVYSFGLTAGTYNSTITVNTNDPVTPTYNLPVTLNLSGTADYVMMDTCFDYGSVLNNSSNLDTLELLNTGCADLYITSTTFSGPHYNIASIDDTIGVGMTGYVVIEFNPTAVGGPYNETLSITTNVQDTTVCLSGTSTLPAVILTADPNPLVVNLSCGDSITEYFTIHSDGSSALNITGGVIGGGGVKDSSTVTYTTTGAMTTHNFNITNTGIDTLWIMVAANGDYDGGIGANEHISDVSVDGISLGIAATQGLTIGNWDSTLFYMVDPDLTTVLADGQLSITVQSGTGVNTGFTNALDQHHVRIYTNGEGWLSGTVTPMTLNSGDSTVVPVTFYSFGLAAGTYNSTISIQSNDPVNPSYELDVILNLNGTANYVLSDSCIDLGITTPGDTTMASFTYTNTGCDDLYITSVTSTNGSFTISSYTDTVGIGQTGVVWVVFNPSAPGTLTGDIQIVTSVQDTIVCMSGIGTNITALFNISTQDSCSGGYTFTDVSVGSATSWFWDFGDGTTSVAQNPTHAYNTLATYTVMFVACNSFGCDTSFQTVTPVFTANYSIIITGALQTGNNIVFQITGSSIIASSWDFGDGSGFPGVQVNHIYSDSGTYVVTVDVTTSAGCMFVLTETIVITDSSSSTGIVGLDTDISIYPNPSDGVFFISVEDDLGKTYDVEILNSIGQSVLAEQNVQLTNHAIRIDKGGLYMIRIVDENGGYLERKITIVK